MKRMITFSLLMLILRVALAQVTVTISVTDGASYTPVEGATVTFPDAQEPTVIETDSSGMAVFTMDVPAENGYHTYTVTAPGYLDYTNEWFYVTQTSTEAYSTAYIKRAYNISFTILNQEGNGIENASVEVKTSPDSVRYTDENGVVSFDGIYSTGTHNYIVSADGYADSTAQLRITKDSMENVMVPAIRLKNAYNIAFTVTDGTNPVEDALVTIGEVSITTDVDGRITFPKKINGTYSYLITRSGYVDLIGTVTVTDGDAFPNVELTSGFDLIFKIINGASGDVGLEQDTVTINNLTKITDASGLLTYGVAAGTTVSFTNEKVGFISVPVNVEDIQKDTTVTIYMVPDYTISYTVYSAVDFLPVEGATVILGTDTIITGADGKAVFNHVAPSADPYQCTVNGPEGSGFITFSESVSAPLSSNVYKWNNNSLSKLAYLQKPNVYINLLVSGGIGFGGVPATVVIDDVEQQLYNAEVGSTYPLDLGTHTYTIIPDNESLAIYSGTFTLSEESPSYTLSFAPAPAKNVEIYTVNTASDPVEGAVVNLSASYTYYDWNLWADVTLVWNVTDTTDDSGLAKFNRFPENIVEYVYSYAATKEEYNEVNASLDISKEFEIVTLTKGQNVIFHITNHDTAVANIPVVMNGETVNTNADGDAVFTEVNAGSYSYTIEADGYDMISGDVAVDDADVTEYIDLTITGINNAVEANIRFYPNPTEGALFVDLPQNLMSGNVRVTVLNIAGVTIYDKQFNSSSGRIQLDISEATIGMYYVKLQGENLERTFKVIKK
ncbi:T9SS type A sorting domain-containing protein [Maribellus sediminis]|uniref:T9SS type A sorting domain-containing protein n=1 Tax=Maribellus sediminis TaxID=2696285 RepID=UPI0014312558|nr:T9SS type A sorting domain-containing protein [Maribellus sediminis]